VGIFCLAAALNKAKGETAMVGNAADTNRMSLLLGFRIIDCALRAFQSKAANRRV
jgi:hypothetical protein